jgi:hypothetical protein
MEQLLATHLMVGGIIAASVWIHGERDDSWMRAIALWVAWPLVGLVAAGLGLKSLYRDVWPSQLRPPPGHDGIFIDYGKPKLPRARVVDPREPR